MTARWKNPCGSETRRSGESVKDTVNKLHRATQNILGHVRSYLDVFSRQKQTLNFDTALERCACVPTIFKQSWYAVPNKTVGQALSAAATSEAVNNLPAMYKYLELLIGAMEGVPPNSMLSNHDNPELARFQDGTINKMLVLLCDFFQLLTLKNLHKLPSVEPSDIPPRPSSQSESDLNDFVIFRETVNFFEILDAVFGHINKNE